MVVELEECVLIGTGSENQDDVLLDLVTFEQSFEMVQADFIGSRVLGRLLHVADDVDFRALCQEKIVQLVNQMRVRGAITWRKQTHRVDHFPLLVFTAPFGHTGRRDCGLAVPSIEQSFHSAVE